MSDKSDLLRQAALIADGKALPNLFGNAPAQAIIKALVDLARAQNDILREISGRLGDEFDAEEDGRVFSIVARAEVLRARTR
jgi:Mg2+/Co2+ transporter CorC